MQQFGRVSVLSCDVGEHHCRRHHWHWGFFAATAAICCMAFMAPYISLMASSISPRWKSVMARFDCVRAQSAVPLHANQQLVGLPERFTCLPEIAFLGLDARHGCSRAHRRRIWLSVSSQSSQRARHDIACCWPSRPCSRRDPSAHHQGLDVPALHRPQVVLPARQPVEHAIGARGHVALVLEQAHARRIFLRCSSRCCCRPLARPRFDHLLCEVLTVSAMSGRHQAL